DLSDVRRGDGPRRTLLCAFERTPRDRSTELTVDPAQLLRTGDIEILGLLPYASNVTLFVKVTKDDSEALAVYKPQRGERPLWDFPEGTLCGREFAAFVVSERLSWGLVPPTVLRDGPAGLGAVQLYVEEDEAFDVRQVVQTHPEELKRMSLFDVVINNADRKAGHIICDTDRKLWAIDHGVCFHDEEKLRTVIWTFEGEPIPDPLLGDLEAFARDPSWKEELGGVLDGIEIDALCSRVTTLLRTKRFPRVPPGRYHVPWPPW